MPLQIHYAPFTEPLLTQEADLYEPCDWAPLALSIHLEAADGNSRQAGWWKKGEQWQGLVSLALPLAAGIAQQVSAPLRIASLS